MVELFFEFCDASVYLDTAKRALFASTLPLSRAARINATRNEQRAALRAAAEASFRRACKRAGLNYATTNVIYDEGGKPRIDGHNDFAVSFSHSGMLGCAIIAKTPDQTPLEIGVDLEKVRPLAERHLGLAERFFSPSLITLFKETPPSERSNAFYRLWTRTEATVKMTGRGMQDCQLETKDLIYDNIREWQLSDSSGATYYATAVYSVSHSPRL